jgi:multiple sugar transport system permease protein
MRSTKSIDILIVLPAILIFVIGIVCPGFYALRSSLLDVEETQWVGLDNYVEILNDPLFWHSLSFTIKYLLLVTCSELILGTYLALAVSSIKFKNFWRGILIAPMFIVPVTTGVIWKLMLHPTVGIVNYLLSFIGISPIEWLAQPFPAFMAVSMMDIWQWTPFIFLLVFAALDIIPQEMYEAAELDGANRLQKFKFLTLPWIRNTLIFAFALRSLEVLKIFDHIFSSTNGGPGYSTEHVSLYLYRIGFKFLQFNKAAAGALIIGLFVLAIWTIFFLSSLQKERSVQ